MLNSNITYIRFRLIWINTQVAFANVTLKNEVLFGTYLREYPPKDKELYSERSNTRNLKFLILAILSLYNSHTGEKDFPIEKISLHSNWSTRYWVVRECSFDVAPQRKFSIEILMWKTFIHQLQKKLHNSIINLISFG